MFEQLSEDVDLDSDLQPWVGLRLTESAFKQGQFEKALQLAEQTLSNHPTFVAGYELRFIKGVVLAKSAKLDSARKEFEAVAEDPVAQRMEAAAIAQWRVGETLFHQENYIQAIRAFEQVVTKYKYPRWNAAALIQAGKCQERLGNWAQAAQLYRQLLDDYPRSPFCKDAKKRLNQVRTAELTTARKVAK